jgi:hypothetical protein
LLSRHIGELTVRYWQDTTARCWRERLTSSGEVVR